MGLLLGTANYKFNLQLTYERYWKKKREKDKANQIARDILKPECDEELLKDEYPTLKDEE